MINDLPSVCKYSSSYLYADDAKFMRINSSVADFQSDLNKIYEWTQCNRIAFNASKCTHIPFRQSCVNDLYFNGVKIEAAEKEKDLGVLVRADLSWSAHIRYRKGKANVEKK